MQFREVGSRQRGSSWFIATGLRSEYNHCTTLFQGVGMPTPGPRRLKYFDPQAYYSTLGPVLGKRVRPRCTRRARRRYLNRSCRLSYCRHPSLSGLYHRTESIDWTRPAGSRLSLFSSSRIRSGEVQESCNQTVLYWTASHVFSGEW